MHIFWRHIVLPAAWRRPTGTRRVEAELVVDLALLGVGKNVIGFLDLLEFLFRGFVDRLQLWAILAGKLTVCLTNLLERRLSRNAAEFVIILFGCRRHSIALRIKIVYAAAAN